jgi:cation:H+ antiporter
VGFGTSAPELLISTIAAMNDSPGLAIGNAIGSNIANIALILGVTALIIPLAIQSRVLRHEFPILMGVMIYAWLLLRDGTLSRIDGVALLIGLVVVMAWLIYDALRAKPDDPITLELAEEIPVGIPTARAFLWFLIGLLILLASSKMLVWGATNIAQMMGVSDLVIGLTIVAVGTSLPELAASVVSALKKEGDLAVGNVIGSNIFNTLGVLALPGLINPTRLDPDILSRDLPAMLGVTGLLFVMAYGFLRSGRLNRPEGGILLISFVGYQALVFLSIHSS